MRFMSIRVLHPGARTTRPNPKHEIYPYLMQDLEIDRVNRVWCKDLKYIPMRKGFLHLVVIMDWGARKVLSWRLPNSLDTALYVEVLEDALATYDTLVIFNND